MSKGQFKFHWGHGIVLTFISFAAFMSYFYVNMSREKIDLVGDHYYEDGQKFQEKLDIIAETKHLKDKVVFSFVEKENLIVLKIPTNTTKLKVDLFFPGDSEKDKHYEYSKTDSIQVIPTNELIKGKWKATVSYELKSKKYMEESIFKID